MVTTSARLQLTLRLASYNGGPYTKHSETSSAGDRLAQLIDTQRRWATLDPKRVELFRGSNFGRESFYDEDTHISRGLLVIATKAPHPSSYHLLWDGWDVYDMSNARNAPLGTARHWKQRPGFKFSGLAISREDNVIAVARGGEARDDRLCEVYFYLLESGTEDELPIQHPKAVAKGSIIIPVNFGTSLSITLAGRTVCFQSSSLCSVWDWRTGEQIIVRSYSDQKPDNSQILMTIRQSGADGRGCGPRQK